jgi:hypothetical protein
MMQQVSSTRIVSDRPASRGGAAGAERYGRMMIIAVPPDLMPPVSLGSTLFQRLRIMVVSDRELDAIGPSQIFGELPVMKRPAAPRFTNGARPRRLHGELLCDEAGRLYEKIGHSVRPIHQLVAGPRGEVLDLTPPMSSHDVIDVPGASDANDLETDASQGGAACHELTPASSQPRIVRFGDFKPMLGPQLMHPERLRDGHRLPCRVRVFEARRAQRIDALASEMLDGASAQLLPLTPALASRLDLADLLPHRPAIASQREAGVLLAGERAVLLTVIHDPTAAMRTTATGTETAPIDVPPRNSPVAAAVTEERRARTTIPERFSAPWQFSLSRDEAIYDLEVRGTRFRLAAFARRLLRRLASARELRKWQALLAGKGFDDQLWTVRPPAGALSTASIREWGRRTLEAGGYDAAAMIREWEIYWARKRA